MTDLIQIELTTNHPASIDSVPVFLADGVLASYADGIKAVRRNKRACCTYESTCSKSGGMGIGQPQWGQPQWGQPHGSEAHYEFRNCRHRWMDRLWRSWGRLGI